MTAPTRARRFIGAAGLTAALLALCATGTEATDNVYLSISLAHARATAMAAARAAAQARARQAQSEARVAAVGAVADLRAAVESRDARPQQVPQFEPEHDRTIGEEHHPHVRRHAYGKG